MALLGRIAGISGIVGGLIRPAAGEAGWRAAFLVGLVAGPVLWGAAGGAVPPVEITAELPVLIAGGLLVGVGTALGSGCTSGHGVCGLARLAAVSRRDPDLHGGGHRHRLRDPACDRRLNP